MPILTFWWWTPSGASARAVSACPKGKKGAFWGRSGASSKVIHSLMAVVDCAGNPLRGLMAAHRSGGAPARAPLCGHTQGSREQRPALHPPPSAPGPRLPARTRNQEIVYLSATAR